MSSPDENADVVELRTSLAAANEARIAAETRLEVVETELSRFKEQHAYVSAAKEAVQQQLREETIRREAAEEKVELLRGQVEQARRSVMALQKQDQDRAAIRAASGGGPSPDTDDKPKRTNAYGRGRPLSALSVASDGGDTLPSPPTTGLRELRLGGGSRAPSMSQVSQRLVAEAAQPKTPVPPQSSGRPSTSHESLDEPKAPTSPQSISSGSSQQRHIRAESIDSAGVRPNAALIAAQAEISQLRHQLDLLKGQFDESEEARVASDQVVKALREFIAADPSEAPPEKLSLPPLPTDPEADEVDEAPAELPTQKWGFGIFGGKSTTSPSSNPGSATLPGTAVSTASSLPAADDETIKSPPMAKSPPMDSFSPPLPPQHPMKVDEDEVIAPAPAGGLGRSLSNFFGRRRASKASSTTASALSAREALAAAVEKDEDEEFASEAARIKAEAVKADAAQTDVVRADGAKADGLGLAIDGVHMNPPSGPDMELTAPTPTTPVKSDERTSDEAPAPAEGPRTPSPKPSSIHSRTKSPMGPRGPRQSIGSIGSIEGSPKSEKKLAPEVEEDEKDEADAPSRADSPPLTSTTDGDDLATPEDSPVPRGNGFALEDKPVAPPPKPTRAPERVRGSRRGRGRGRGAAV